MVASGRDLYQVLALSARRRPSSNPSVDISVCAAVLALVFRAGPEMSWLPGYGMERG